LLVKVGFVCKCTLWVVELGWDLSWELWLRRGLSLEFLGRGGGEGGRGLDRSQNPLREGGGFWFGLDLG
jgi:hypothetical protein